MKLLNTHHHVLRIVGFEVVTRRLPTHNVGDVDILPSEAGFAKDSIKKFSGKADEGTTLLHFMFTGVSPDQKKTSRLIRVNFGRYIAAHERVIIRPLG